MWTAPAPGFEPRSYVTDAWRVVESQSRVATMKLVDSLDEQAILEAELEGSKPVIPASCAGLDYLLATPFRYSPYPYGSRFRRARQREGCFYGSELVETAMAEAAFYHLRFFLDSPGTTLPINPQERTAFCIPISTPAALDLMVAPLVEKRAVWTHPTDYGPCQVLADQARAAGIVAIRYQSVRDPRKGANMALLSPAGFAAPSPTDRQTWWLMLRRNRVEALREMPRLALSFSLADWAVTDTRIPTEIEC